LELPPLNVNNITNANDANIYPPTQLYLFGDVRGNENPALVALHTLFLREHNRRARELALQNPGWTDEELYQESRRWVIALLEHITFDEYYPVTVGDGALSYPGYNSSINPTRCAEFSTGAFRYGHSEVSEWVWRVSPDNVTIPQGNLHLRNSYFTSPVTIAEVGIEPILLGMAYFPQNAVDIYFVDDLRNYLFGAPGSGGMDLAALNTKRGRDHGLPGFNDYRVLFGLDPYTEWAVLNPDPNVYTRLAAAYESIDDCDVYVCGVAEYHEYANVGETFASIIESEYIIFETSDRFWYENGQWNATDLAMIKSTTLADVIARNTPIQTPELQCWVFCSS